MDNKEVLDEEGITIHEIYIILKNNFIMICLVVVLFAGLGIAYTKAVGKEVFQSEAKIIISVSSGESNKIDFSYSMRVLYTYRDILKSNHIFKKIENQNFTAGKLEVVVPSDSLVISVKYSNTDFTKAKVVLEQILKEAKDYITSETEDINNSLLNKEDIRVMDPPTEARKISPNLVMNVLIFSFIGFIIICVGVLIKEMINNTVKSDEELEKLTNYSVLAEIPEKKAGGYYNEKDK